MKSKLFVNLAASAALFIGMASTSQAFLINSTTTPGDTWTTYYLLEAGNDDGNGNTNPSTEQDISGNILFTLSAFDSINDFITLELKVSNTSVLQNPTNDVGWQKIAFGVDPDAKAVTFIDNDTTEFVYAQIGVDPEVSNALGGVLTITCNQNNPNCNVPPGDIQTGAGNGAPAILLEGEMDIFSLKIEFDDLTSAGATFDPFSSKWQTGYGSYEFGGYENGSSGGGPSTSGGSTSTSTGSTGGPPGQVPEPGVLALFGLGLLSGVLVRRRSKNLSR